jgi:hypothetical protein
LWRDQLAGSKQRTTCRVRMFENTCARSEWSTLQFLRIKDRALSIRYRKARLGSITRSHGSLSCKDNDECHSVQATVLLIENNLHVRLQRCCMHLSLRSVTSSQQISVIRECSSHSFRFLLHFTFLTNTTTPYY